MSVESFYFCADQRQALHWWRQPLAKTLDELATWRIDGRPTHPYLMSDESLQEELLAYLQAVQVQYPSAMTLNSACQKTLARLATDATAPSPSVTGRLRNLFRSTREQAQDEPLRDVGGFIDFYIMLLETARRGPSNEPVDIRASDFFLASYLQQFLSPGEAEQYNAAVREHTLGLCLPPEMTNLDRATIARLEPWIGQISYLVDARQWQQMWERLDELPELWSYIEQQVSPKATKHLQAIGDIARFAVEHDLVMLKQFC
jgi:hypothetical protein